jgi:hypothetical protein
MREVGVDEWGRRVRVESVRVLTEMVKRTESSLGDIEVPGSVAEPVTDKEEVVVERVMAFSE